VSPLRSCDIVCRSSENLDPGKGRVHKNYNGWIENPNNAIRRGAAAGLMSCRKAGPRLPAPGTTPFP
jgi:hypothetical protein